MAKPTTFGKKENEKKKQARRLEKQNRKEERKLSGNTNSFEDMIAYVDENGRITSTPPETNRKIIPTPIRLRCSCLKTIGVLPSIIMLFLNDRPIVSERNVT